ncbi:MAG: tetratricopeptide repeat protein [Candidatus Melainabacteria bacterium]|nr:tetratricopeptide repeat protein [Candidatus Melainabacteria bacterium]
MPKRVEPFSLVVPLAISLTLAAVVWQAPVAIAQQYTDAQGRPVSKDVYDGVQLMNEASQFLNQNKNAEAVFRLERAAQLAPDVADVHYNYGIALAKMGQTEEAVKQYQDATRLNSEMPYAWINLGASYQLLGKIEEAVQAYTEFVTRFPGNQEAGKIKNLIVGLNKELGRQTNLPPPRQSTPAQTQPRQSPPQDSGGFRPINGAASGTSPGFGTPQTPKVDRTPQGGNINQGGGLVGFDPPSSPGLSGWQGSPDPGSQPRDPGGLVSGQPSAGLSGWQGVPDGQPGVSGGGNPGREAGQGGFQQGSGGFQQGNQGGFQQASSGLQQGGQTGYAQQKQQPADPSRFGPPDEPPVQQPPAQIERPPAAVQRPPQQPAQQPPKKPVQVAVSLPPQNPSMGQPPPGRPQGAPGHPSTGRPVAPGGNPPAGTASGGSNSTSNYLNDVGGARLGKWPANRMPLKVCIVPASNVQGYQPAFDQCLIKCFQDWGNASGGSVSFKGESDPKAADIVCTWTSDTSKFMNTAEAGETVVYGSKNGIQHVTIQILTVPHPMSPGVPLSENRLRWICLHEIGHALGLGGHTRNPQDIMFFSTPLAEVWKELTPRDCNTLQSLYSK